MLVHLQLVLAANKRNSSPPPPPAFVASCSVVNAWETGWLAEIQLPPEMATASVVVGFAGGLASATSVYQLESELRDAPEGEKLASAKVTLSSSLDNMFEFDDGTTAQPGGSKETKEEKKEKKEKKKGKAPVWVRFSVDDPIVKPLVRPSRSSRLRRLDFARAKTAAKTTKADGGKVASANADDATMAAAMARAAAQQHDAAAAALERLKSPGAEDVTATSVSAQRAQELALQAASEQTAGKVGKDKAGQEREEDAIAVASIVDAAAVDDDEAEAEAAAVPMWQQRQAQKQAEAGAASLRSFLKQQPGSGVLVVRLEVMVLTCGASCQKAAACYLVGPPSPPAPPAPPYSAPAPPKPPAPPPPPDCGVPLTYEVVKAKPTALTAQLRMPRTRAIEILGVSGAHIALDFGSHALARLDSAYFSKSEGGADAKGLGLAASGAVDATGQAAAASGGAAEDVEATAWSRAQLFANVSDGVTTGGGGGGGGLLAGASSSSLGLGPWRVVTIELTPLDDSARVAFAKAAWESGDADGEPNRELIISLHMTLARPLGPKDTPPKPNLLQAKYGRAPRLDEHDLEGANVADSVIGVQPFDPRYDDNPDPTADDDDDDDDDDDEPVQSTALARRTKPSQLTVRLTVASDVPGKKPRAHTFQIKRKRMEKSFDGLCVAVLEALPSSVRLTGAELLRMRVAFEEDGGGKPTELSKQSDMRSASRRASAVVITPRQSKLRRGDDDPAHCSATDPASDAAPHDAKASRAKRKGASGGTKSARKALPPPPMYHD